MPAPNQKPIERSSPVPTDIRDNGLWAFESRHAETFSMQVTQHPFLKLLWIREGEASIEFETTSSPCEMGNWVIVAPRLKHRIIDSPSKPVSLYGLGIDFRKLKCIQPVLPILKSGVYRELKFQSLRVEQQLRRILYLIDQQDVASQLSSVSTALDLIAELALVLAPPKRFAENRVVKHSHPEKLPADPMMEAYIDWLHRNFYESLTLDDAAASTRLSRRSFTSQFKARTGMTWLEYLNVLRIRRAEELLNETDRKVTSIAFQCGFDDLTTFYRAFKRVTGRTPGTRGTR